MLASGGSYLSSNELIMTFGLAGHTQADTDRTPLAQRPN